MACDAPITIKYNPPMPDGKGGLIYTFPADCGKCLKCLLKRKAQWSFRLVEEKRNSFSSYFVTLTYDDKNIPRGDECYSSNKNDHFDFIKNLKANEKPKALALRSDISMEEYQRKIHGIKSVGKLKYFAVSEYGERLCRPHWHYILFNVRDIRNIDLSWGKGIIQIDECNINTIDYVLKYMLKYPKGADMETREKEKSYMSKGIGVNAFNGEIIEHIRKIDGNQIINARGTKIPVPRYYRKKYLSDMDREKQNIYISQQIEMQEKTDDAKLKRSGLNPDKVRLNAKENRRNLLLKKQNRNLE